MGLKRLRLTILYGEFNCAGMMQKCKNLKATIVARRTPPARNKIRIFEARPSRPAQQRMVARRAFSPARLQILPNIARTAQRDWLTAAASSSARNAAFI